MYWTGLRFHCRTLPHRAVLYQLLSSQLGWCWYWHRLCTSSCPPSTSTWRLTVLAHSYQWGGGGFMHNSSINGPTYRFFTLRETMPNMSMKALKDSPCYGLMLRREREETSCRQLVLKWVVNDEVSMLKETMENGGKLWNPSRVGPWRVNENALHKIVSSVE